MSDLNSLLVSWTIERTAEPFPTPEILVANQIIRTGVKTTPEALEAAVVKVLANHQTLLDVLFKRIAEDAKQLVKTHRTAKEDFTGFWKRVFCKRNPSPATDTTSYLRETVSEVFGGTPAISLANMVLLLDFFYQTVESAFLGKSTDRFVLQVPTEHQYDTYRAPKGLYCFKALTIAEALAIRDFIVDSKITKLTEQTENLKLNLDGEYIQLFVESLNSHRREIIGETVSTYMALVNISLHQCNYVEFEAAELGRKIPISMSGKLQSEFIEITPEYYEGLNQAERLLFVYKLYEQLRLVRAAISAKFHIDIDIVVSGNELEYCAIKGTFREGGDSKHVVNVTVSCPEYQIIGPISS